MTSSGKWPITQLTKRSILCFPIPRGTLFFHPNNTWVLSQENLKTITYTKVGGGGGATECTICTRPIIYLVCPQKFCISTVFNFSWDVITKCKIWRWEVYYERCALGMGPDEIVNYFFFLVYYIKIEILHHLMNYMSEKNPFTSMQMCPYGSQAFTDK